jgi:hypothetical protein
MQFVPVVIEENERWRIKADGGMVPLARFQPAPDQTDQAWITDSMRHEPRNRTAFKIPCFTSQRSAGFRSTHISTHNLDVCSRGTMLRDASLLHRNEQIGDAAISHRSMRAMADI